MTFSFVWQGHYCCKRDCSYEWAMQVLSHLVYLYLSHILLSWKPVVGEISTLKSFPSLSRWAFKHFHLLLFKEPQESVYHKKHLNAIWTINTNICIAITINILYDRHIQIPEYIYFSAHNMTLNQHRIWFHENHRDDTKQLHMATSSHKHFLNIKESTSHESAPSLTFQPHLSELSLGTDFHKTRGLQYSWTQENLVLCSNVIFFHRNVQ